LRERLKIQEGVMGKFGILVGGGGSWDDESFIQFGELVI